MKFRLPKSFTNIFELIKSLGTIWYSNLYTLLIFNIIIGFSTIFLAWYCNFQLLSYFTTAEEKGQIPSHLLSRFLLLGEMAIFLTFFPALLLCSYFALWQLENKPSSGSGVESSEPITLLIRKSSSSLLLLGSGWMTALIKGINRIFLFIICVCLSGFISGKYQSDSLDTCLIILNSIWFSVLLLKLSSLIVLPWLSLSSASYEIRRGKVEIKEGAIWLILASWLSAALLVILFTTFLKNERGSTLPSPHLTYQLAIHGIQFYVPQPFLWFIAIVARQYAVLIPRKKKKIE